MKILAQVFFTAIVLIFSVFNSFVKAFTFNDISGTSYQAAILDLANKGIIEGYSDGSYRPFSNINRAEFTKILIESRYPKVASGENCFPDVYQEWFAKYICFAKQKKIINGYPEGIFGPERNINLAEALKITLETYNFDIPDSSTTQWYEKYFWFAQPKGLINGITQDVGRNINRGEVAQLIYNITEYVSPTIILSKPVLISPINNTPISPASADINFTWNVVQGAVSYDLILSKNDGAPIIYPAGNNTTYNITLPILDPIPGQTTSYSWKIRANGLNKNSVVSDQWYFTVSIGSKQPTVWDLYQIQPTQSEIDTITADFNLVWADQSGPINWPDDFKFDQKSTDPSKIVIISKLNALKHQEFSEPLPFTSGKSIYEYVKTYLNHVPLSLSCIGGLNWSVWDGRSSADCIPSPTPTLLPYVHHLQVFVHEARHSEPGEPAHSSCNLSNMLDHDEYLENGSGYSAAALYLMWVYKYSINEADIVKEAARAGAVDLLKNRFCTKPTHSNPKVQAIIDELLDQ